MVETTAEFPVHALEPVQGTSLWTVGSIGLGMLLAALLLRRVKQWRTFLPPSWAPPNYRGGSVLDIAMDQQDRLSEMLLKVERSASRLDLSSVDDRTQLRFDLVSAMCSARGLF